MDTKFLRIGRWKIQFVFAIDGYDIDTIIRLLSNLDASDDIIDDAYRLMSKRHDNTGFTYTDGDKHNALVVIGKASSDEEFINTLIHEIHHLAVAIALGVGVDLESETPAYLSGNLAFELAEYLCTLGCRLV